MTTRAPAERGTRPRPVVLVVLDGFGLNGNPDVDAIAAATDRMPMWYGLIHQWPGAVLGASGTDVGLPPGQMGNSEVGHLNLGAGRPVLQDLPRIDASIADNSFFKRPALIAACDHAVAGSGTLHVISLIGPGGVHANDRHLVAIAELAKHRKIPRVRIHALLDGRDTPPASALGFIKEVERRLRFTHPDARIASVGGRYFAMDRDQRWERTERGYDAIVHGEALYHATSATAAIEDAYARGETDEFVAPTVIDDAAGQPLGIVEDGDAIIHANFRADRARQLTHALVDGRAFAGFDRTSPSGRLAPKKLFVVTMTQYEARLKVQVAFPPDIVRSLADAVSEAGWKQFHVAETEKYAHVTYFFNGGLEKAHRGEVRQLIPSQRVATYDLAPEMSARGVTDALVEAIGSGKYDFIVANYANPDMFGHTGHWEATIDALATIDSCLTRIVNAVNAVEADDPDAPGALLAITADHGNADQLLDAAGQPVTAHSMNPVPFVLVGRRAEGLQLRNGVLADVAPTLLQFLELPRWEGMTGRTLIL